MLAHEIELTVVTARFSKARKGTVFFYFFYYTSELRIKDLK
jgi:hypothetical protein